MTLVVRFDGSLVRIVTFAESPEAVGMSFPTSRLMDPESMRDLKIARFHGLCSKALCVQPNGKKFDFCSPVAGNNLFAKSSHHCEIMQLCFGHCWNRKKCGPVSCCRLMPLVMSAKKPVLWIVGGLIVVALAAWLLGSALSDGPRSGPPDPVDEPASEAAPVGPKSETDKVNGKPAPAPGGASLSPPVPDRRMGAVAPEPVGDAGNAEQRRSSVAKHYAGADRLGRTERSLPDGGIKRVTLLRTDLKYPLVRVVDRMGPVEASGGRPIRESVAMAAGHFLVEPVKTAGGDVLRARLEEGGWVVRAELPLSGRWLVAPSVGAIMDSEGDRFPELQAALAAELGDLATVEPDYLFYAEGLADDPSFANGSLWGLRNTGQSGGTAGADIRAVEAWDIRNDASDVVVAVVDTGVRMTHEDIAPNLWTNPGEIPGNGIDDDGNGVIDDVHGFDAIDGGGDPSDEDGHGTHVAGTVGAAGNNATGVTGVAWEVRIMPIRFLGDGGGFLSDVIEGIAYARANGATILNNSWGGGGFSTSLRNAIADLAAGDILFVAAAGNDGADSDGTPLYPAAYDLPHIVSVAASDRNDRRAGFSNFGAESVDLAAPGASIRSTFNGGDASYATLSGTSMASPHVAGALAVLRAEFPDEDAASLKARLLDTVDPLADFATTTVSGGRLNLEAALLNEATPRPGALRFATDQGQRGGERRLGASGGAPGGRLGRGGFRSLSDG